MAESKGKGGTGKQSGLRNERGREREIKIPSLNIDTVQFYFPPAAHDFFFFLPHSSSLLLSPFCSLFLLIFFLFPNPPFLHSSCCQCSFYIKSPLWCVPPSVFLPNSFPSILFFILSLPLISWVLLPPTIFSPQEHVKRKISHQKSAAEVSYEYKLK